MTFQTWLLFLVMETALSLSPGPAVFYVVSQGIRAFPRAVPATLGILSANACYFALSATSLGALIAASARFFTIAKWAGAAYLIFLGIKSLRSAAASHSVSLTGTTGPGEGNVHRVHARGGQLSGPEPRGLERRQIYLGALTLQLSNPKALLFFLALLPQFIDTQRAVAPQMLILAATSMLPECSILLAYGWLAHRAAHASAKFGVTRSMNRWLAWVEGVGLLGCATLVLKFSRS
ncbi:MAG TPA: LysE family translocator [Steroidobacteraceae bacterium]|nr:LysE family translocator [Steroidobacteraceae bacterium]